MLAIAHLNITYQASQDKNATLITRAPGPTRNTALPVMYLNFAARYTDSRQVQISRATSFERDNAWFAVERSNDLNQFTELGRLAGQGTSQARQNYDFTDEAPAPGYNYYRLKQVDTNGVTAYSRAIAVLNEGSLDTGLRLYPSPAASVIGTGSKNPVRSAAFIDGRGGRQP